VPYHPKWGDNFSVARIILTAIFGFGANLQFDNHPSYLAVQKP
jgi:hypothetical protein